MKSSRILIFLLLVFQFGMAQKKEDTALKETLNDGSLIGKSLLELYESKADASGLTYYKSPRIANFIHSKSDIFIQAGSSKVSAFNDLMVTQLVLTESKNDSKIGSKRVRYLFVEKSSANSLKITDTLKVGKDLEFATNVVLENNRTGIAIGTFQKKKEFFEIKELYEINKAGKISKLDINTLVYDLPVPNDYVKDEDSGKYRFGTKNGKKYSRFWNDIKALKVNKYKHPKGFTILDSAQVKFKDRVLKVIVIQKKEKNNSNFGQTVSILENTKDGFNLINTNENLISKLEENCNAQGFARLVAKDNYFTIEKSFCRENLLIFSYATFKILETEIVLHKYGEKYSDISNPEKAMYDKIWTPKTFGVIKFEAFNDEVLKKIIKE